VGVSPGLGVLLACPSGSQRSGARQSGRGVAGRRRRRPPRARAAIVCAGLQRSAAPAQEAPGWPVLAPPVGPAKGTDAAIRQASQAQPSPVAPGLRGLTKPAAIRPVGREPPARSAALALLIGVGVLVYGVLPRQGRLSRRAPARHGPGHQGLTDTPAAAVVCALVTPGRLVHCAVAPLPSFQGQGGED
jgi:hypothetical protein